MPRRAAAAIRPIESDPMYGSKLVQQLINKVMVDGKKSTAEQIVYDALEILSKRTNNEPVPALEESIKILTPMLEVRSRRVGGATYQVPVEVPQRRARTLAVRWLVEFARERREKTMAERLAGELADAQSQQGARLQAQGRHLPHGAGQQGLRPLPLVAAARDRRRAGGVLGQLARVRSTRRCLRPCLLASRGPAPSGGWCSAVRAAVLCLCLLYEFDCRGLRRPLRGARARPVAHALRAGLRRSSGQCGCSRVSRARRWQLGLTGSAARIRTRRRAEREAARKERFVAERKRSRGRSASAQAVRNVGAAGDATALPPRRLSARPIEAYNRRDLAALRELMTEDVELRRARTRARRPLPTSATRASQNGLRGPSTRAPPSARHRAAASCAISATGCWRWASSHVEGDESRRSRSARSWASCADVVDSRTGHLAAGSSAHATAMPRRPRAGGTARAALRRSAERGVTRAREP